MAVIIIGSGIAGVTFAEKYRSLNPEQAVTLITHEQHGYYSRPLLSRGFSKGDIEQSIILKSFAQLQESGIEVISGAEALAIDRPAKRISFTHNQQNLSRDYQQLVLATGSAAFIPPPYQPYKDLFFTLNNLDDLIRLRRFRAEVKSRTRPHWAIIGGGLIGCEIASDLAVSGDKVTIYHTRDRLMERQLDELDSSRLLDVFTEGGVEVRFEQQVQTLAAVNQQVAVHTETETDRLFDGVLVCCGFKPRIELAAAVDLAVGRGIKVDSFMRTANPDIFALGDVAELPDGKIYAYILPIRSQALWLAGFLNGQTDQPWAPPKFVPKPKVHGFEPVRPAAF